jgi:hypothetical protein
MKVQNGNITLPTGGTAVGQYLRVLVASGGTAVALAGADDIEFGTTAQNATTLDTLVPVVPRTVEGTKKFVASGAITQYAEVFAAASGKISATGNGRKIGYAIEPAAANGDVIEVLPVEDAKKTCFTPQTVAAAGSVQGDAGLITANAPSTVLVTGADATKGVILPAAFPGAVHLVKNRDSDNAILKVYPATGGAINALAANGAISMAAKTSAVFMSIDGTNWVTIPLLPS